MTRVVLVSNRVLDGDAPQAGGMGVAIASILDGREALWFGWSGAVTDDAEETSEPQIRRAGNATVATVDLSPADHRDFYLGYSNSVVWPVFHNRLDLAQFEAGYYTRYRNVNARFARTLAGLLRPDDVIWVHDYHLLPLALELRALGCRQAIGFFLHVPVPPAQTFLAIPEHKDLAEGLAAFDLVGVQTRADVRNLLDFLGQAVNGRLLNSGRIRAFDREVTIESFPVSIDLGDFAHVEPQESASARQPCRILGIDRLDYTKGLPSKFRAFGRLLQENPEYRGHVVLSQIAPPTRESVEAYADIRAELEALAGEINGRFGDLDWMPIHYIHRATSRDKLAAIYRSSRVCAVTPLRDGMNLVAKEYVAAQDSDDPGVLVLSMFAGAAEQLDGAILINPYDIDGMAAALKAALEMPLDERRTRHAKLLEIIRENDAESWCRSFMQSLEGIRKSHEDDFGPLGGRDPDDGAAKMLRRLLPMTSV